jgi:hypothetical protein
MSNNGRENSGWTLGNILSPAEQAAWDRLYAVEAELRAARWAVIETTNRESARRRVFLVATRRREPGDCRGLL